MVMEALLIILSYLYVASDLNTQCLSRQQQANNTPETSNHVLTEITVGLSRELRVPTEARPTRNAFFFLGAIATLCPRTLCPPSGHSFVNRTAFMIPVAPKLVRGARTSRDRGR